VGTDADGPELQDERREDIAGLDLEGFGNLVQVFQPQTPADGKLLLWGSAGVVRSGPEGCWSGWGQPVEGRLHDWEHPASVIQDFVVFLPGTAVLLVSIAYASE